LKKHLNVSAGEPRVCWPPVSRAPPAAGVQSRCVCALRRARRRRQCLDVRARATANACARDVMLTSADGACVRVVYRTQEEADMEAKDRTLVLKSQWRWSSRSRSTCPADVRARGCRVVLPCRVCLRHHHFSPHCVLRVEPGACAVSQAKRTMVLIPTSN
jgi:hypothetical protein